MRNPIPGAPDGARKKIGDLEFTVYKLDPMSSLKLLRKLGAVVVPTVGATLGQIGGGLTKLLDRSVDLGAGGRELFSRLDDALLDELVDKFGRVSQTKAGWVFETFDAVFRGKTELVLEWLWFCLLSEYEGIVKKAKGGIDRAGLSTLLRRFDSALSSPTSTPSTDSSSEG